VLIYELIRSESKAKKYLSKKCLKNGHRICPRCNSRKRYKLADGRYRCSRCLYAFHDFSGRPKSLCLLPRRINIANIVLPWYVVSMEKTDARKLSPETQYEIRKQVIRLRKQGFPHKVLSAGLGISVGCANKIWQRYKKEGSKAIKLGVRGRRLGECRTLSVDQELAVSKALIDKTPDQMKLPFALWTREAVKLLIRQWFGIEMPIRTVGEYLKRWGFTPQKPVKRAYEQSSRAVKVWLETEYPLIASRAKQEKAEIHWGDETGIQTGANRIRGFAPRGETPVVRMVAKKNHISMISAITNGGKVRFMMYRDAMNYSSS